MNKMLYKFGYECYGFRQLFSPKGLYRMSPCLLSTTSRKIASLPKLPVPALEKTMEKYIRSVEPHLTPEEFAKSKEVVQDFVGGVGAKLQKLLEERAQRENNWLSDWWLHSAYLDYRSPVVVWSNPGLVFPFKNFDNHYEQVRYASKMILAAMDYKRLIDGDLIEQQMMGKDPLDMSQFKKVFGTCRIPGLERDSITFNDSDYIVVFHNGHIFQLHLSGEDKIPLTEDQLYAEIEKLYICSQSKCDFPVGIMTTEHRDVWGKVYKALSEDESNRAALSVIEKSLFVMCLDKPMETADKCSPLNRQTIAAGQTIHGGGSLKNSGNRWFDKTIQFIVSEDGINGLTYEHSPAEGQPIAILTDHIIDFITLDKNSRAPLSGSVREAIKLEFNINSDIQMAITKAKGNLDKLVNDLELDCFTFPNFGKNFIKSHKLSPDSFIQMAMQFAFYRLHKKPAGHYESAATRKYEGGRTETIRSCSVESVNFAQAMLDESVSVNDKIKALKTAIQAHKDYSLQAVNGFGVDRHLLGLKLIAIENNIQVPQLYSDPSFVKSSHFRISSSQVAAKCNSFMCYGPLVNDGYATCYNPRDHTINFATAAFKNSVTNVNKYRHALEDSLINMGDVLLLGTKSKL